MHRIQHNIPRFGVMFDVLPDGIMRFLRPIGVHVVDSRGFGGSDGFVEGLDLVLISRWVVGRGTLFHKALQVGIWAGGIVSLWHLGDGAFGK
jgi:hypothetical protein